MKRCESLIVLLAGVFTAQAGAFLMLAGASLGLAGAGVAQAGDWPHWRGPNFNGTTDEKNLPSDWSRTENIAWSVELPGSLAATPIVSKDRTCLPVFVSGKDNAPPAAEVFAYLRGLGNGSYLFGQMATWVHNENPDMDHPTNWLKKVYDHTGKMPRYGCVTYDFHDNPFPDSAWNKGVEEMWDRGMIVGVFSFYANPTGRSWNSTLDIDPIFATGDNPTKTNFYNQMNRMASNLQWLKDRGVPVVYTPFVESDDRNKWHAKEGSQNAIKLYRLVHDYFKNVKGLDNVIWAYHTTANHGALEKYYPGDAYVDVLGKSAYGAGLNFSEYRWAVEKKKNKGKAIWWSELGIRGKTDPQRDCMDLVKKLENTYPELAGFVFWSDDGHYNVLGNKNGSELMACPKIITLK